MLPDVWKRSSPAASVPNPTVCTHITTMNSTPVSTTRNSEMPSTPRFQAIPNSSIQVWREANWKPGSAITNCVSR